jgi:hypothetical protein
MALHLFMIIGFSLAVALSFRRSGSLASFACSIAPFILGAIAMWFGILCFAEIVPSFSSGLYDGDPLSTLQMIQQPFFIGSGLSLVALVIYFLTRAHHTNPRKG